MPAQLPHFFTKLSVGVADFRALGCAPAHGRLSRDSICTVVDLVVDMDVVVTEMFHRWRTTRQIFGGQMVIVNLPVHVHVDVHVHVHDGVLAIRSETGVSRQILE